MTFKIRVYEHPDKDCLEMFPYQFQYDNVLWWFLGQHIPE